MGEWVNGSETFADPYLIKNMIINATGISCPIWIERSAAYFIIRNYTIFNASTGELTGGIHLNYCSNGILDNNNCSSNSENGITLQHCTNMTITNNTCNYNRFNGICLYYSDNNTLINNTTNCNSEFAFYNGRGLYLNASDNLIVESNHMANNEREGCIVPYLSNINFKATLCSLLQIKYSIYDPSITHL